MTRGALTVGLGWALVAVAGPAITTFSSGQSLSSAAVNNNFNALAQASWSTGMPTTPSYYVTGSSSADATVGVGTVPAADLHVYSAAGADPLVLLDSDGGNGTYIDFNDHVGGTLHNTADIASVSGNLILNDNGGNVGIGTDAPDVGLMVTAGSGVSLTKGSGELQVGGDAVGTDVDMGFDGQDIQVRTAAGAASRLNLQPNGGNAQVGTTSNNSDLFVLGSLGVGTQTPSTPFNVNGGTASVVSLTAGTGYLQLGSSTNMAMDYHQIQVRTSAGATAGLLLQQAGGDVTLGTSSNASDLTVNGNVTATGNVSATGTVGGSNYPAGIALHTTGSGNNGTKSCDSYCPLVNGDNTPHCVAAYTSAGSVSCSTASEVNPTTCLCGAF